MYDLCNDSWTSTSGHTHPHNGSSYNGHLYTMAMFNCPNFLIILPVIENLPITANSLQRPEVVKMFDWQTKTSVNMKKYKAKVDACRRLSFMRGPTTGDLNL